MIAIPFKEIFRYQIWQWLSALTLIIVLQFIISFDKEILLGSFWKTNTTIWLWIAIASPILHQLYVWIAWRIELHTNALSKYFGENKSFEIYKIMFSILFISRLITIIFLALSNSHSLHIASAITYVFIAIITPLTIYLFYSVKKYFTIDRAFGIDHFKKNFNLPYVKQGIFRYTDNGMYIFGLMILYLPGLILSSKAALLAAAFNHIFIWAHFYCTERPDMKEIYGS